GCGTAFDLIQSGGSWSYKTLYSFTGNTDGCNPVSQLKPGPTAGTLVGATFNGPGSGYGTLFELKRSNGVWSESVIHSFVGSDGVNPNDLDEGTNGTIYGVTLTGGTYGGGVVFQLSPNENDWTYSVIRNFRGGSDGFEPIGINFDGDTGALYGATAGGGAYNQGTIFRLTYDGSSWRKRTLHHFQSGN